MPELTDAVIKDLKIKFLNRLESIIDEICQDIEKRDDFPYIVKSHIKEMLSYNLEGGKMIRGLCVVNTGYSLCKDWNATIEDHFIILGWCVEFLQAMFLIADDIMDEGQLRRNKLCWYKLEHVGMISIDDIFILESQIHLLIKKYFGPSSMYTIINNSIHYENKQNDLSICQENSIEREKKMYEETLKDASKYIVYCNLLNILNEVHYMTSIGQYIDTYISIERNVASKQTEEKEQQYNVYSLQNYYDIIVNKTSYYTFYLPIILAYTYIQYLYPPTSPDYVFINKDKTILICKEIGKFFQIQDDYLDFYAHPSILGKIGQDVEEAKCSWLYIQLLLACNNEDQKYCQQNYGNKKSDYVHKIKDMYIKYNLKDKYLKFQQEQYIYLLSLIEDNKEVIPYNICISLVNKISQRNS